MSDHPRDRAWQAYEATYGARYGTRFTLNHDGARPADATDATDERQREREIDAEIDGSFPASDPPARTALLGAQVQAPPTSRGDGDA